MIRGKIGQQCEVFTHFSQAIAIALRLRKRSLETFSIQYYRNYFETPVFIDKTPKFDWPLEIILREVEGVTAS